MRYCTGILQGYYFDYNSLLISQFYRTLLDGYFWRVHATICRIQNEIITPDKIVYGIYMCIIRAHICSKEKKSMQAAGFKQKEKP